MHLANPIALLLWIPLAALIAAREVYSHRFRATLPFPDISLLKSVAPTWRTRMARWPAYFIYAGLFLGVLALARPQKLLRGEEAKAKGIDILITLDTSGSMRALDFDPIDRMSAAKNAAKSFIERRKYDRIGLVAFAGVSILQCPLTLDYAALLEFLDQVDVGITSTENTAIGTAIATASNHLKKSNAKSKVIILVTDGRSNAGEIDPPTAAKAASAVGIKIYTIGVGIRGQSMIPAMDAFGNKRLLPIAEDLDEPTLQDIAQLTGGQYYRAASPKEFNAIFATIDKLEKTEIQGPSPNEYQDLYKGWLLAGLILLAAGAGLQQTVLRTWP